MTAGEHSGGSTRGGDPHWEKTRIIAGQLAEIAAPNLRTMGFGRAADALDGRDRSTEGLNAAVYNFANNHGYTPRELSEAQSATWPLEKIAYVAASETLATSGPITSSEDRGMGMPGSYPTRQQLYAMPGLHQARAAAEPTRTLLPTTNADGEPLTVPPGYEGAYTEERRFSMPELPEVEFVETRRYLADGTPLGSNPDYTPDYAVIVSRTDFGLPPAPATP